MKQTRSVCARANMIKLYSRKIFVGYSRYFSVTELLLELGLPSWNNLC